MRAFFENCAPLQIKETDRKVNNYSWAIKDMSDELYKVMSGKFKTYFVLNTNCALLSEVLLDKTGIPKSRAFGGTVTPGSAYALYKRKLAKKQFCDFEKGVFK